MITKIVVENFKSFEKRTELNMISSSKIRLNPDHCISTNGPRLLKHAAIYGANAAGKSNLIEAISFFKYTVINGLPLFCTNLFCKNDEENSKKESLFEIQFELYNKFYAYGFSAKLYEKSITAEWLYELKMSGASNCIFERDKDNNAKIGNGIKLTKEERIRFDTYASDFLGNSSELFLRELGKGKKYSPDSEMLVFEKIYNMIKDKIVVITPNSKLVNFQQYYNEESLKNINELIKTFDTGISNIKIEQIDADDLKKMIPEPILNNLLKELDNNKQSNNTPVLLSGRTDRSFFNIELRPDGDPIITTIKLKHGSSILDFDFEEESDGTRRLFDLVDILLKKTDDSIYFVDELERSLHPKLTEHFLELFDLHHKEHNVQLIFTTHESSIMDQKLFRRDEIWFIERDAKNNSIVYPLDKFKERYDKKLSKAYLEGRYGAIPIFKTFSFIQENG